MAPRADREPLVSNPSQQALGGGASSASGRRGRRSRVVAAAATSVMLASAHVRAWHDDRQRITDDTAYTLQRHDVRLGIWKLQYGIWDPFTAGTYLWPWLGRVPNIHAKWRYWFDDPWALSFQFGGFWMNTKSFKNEVDKNAGDATIAVLPIELNASYRFNEAWTLSGGLAYTEVRLRGELHSDDFDGVAQGAVDNLQLTCTLEWRLSRVTALTLHSRYLILQRIGAGGDAVLHPDDFTIIEVHGGASSDALDFKSAYSVTAAAVFSWQTFNLRLGLGYGNYNVPAVNFVLPRKIVYPDLDLYWIF